MLKKLFRKTMNYVMGGIMLGAIMVAVTPAVQASADTIYEVEPNDNPGTANQLPLNTEVIGTAYEEADWYEFTIPARGYSSISVNPTADNLDDDSWQVHVYDSARHELIYRPMYSSTVGLGGWAPGKYYLEISSHIVGVGFPNSGKYCVKVNYKKSNYWEKEIYYPNKSYKNANQIALNKTYTGVLYCGNDIDYYRVKGKGKNKITLKYTIDDSVADPGTVRIEFIEYNTKKSLDYWNINTNESLTVDCTGDCIIKISNYEYATGDYYHIKVSESPILVTPKINSVTAGEKNAVIRWNKVSNATGYYVYRSMKANGTYQKIATVKGKTSYKDTGVKSKQSYYYKICAYNKTNNKTVTSPKSAAKKVKIK